MMTAALSLLAVLVTLKWDCSGVTGKYFVVQGTSIANQAKSQVQLRVVKEVQASACSTQLDLPIAAHVIALWGGQHQTTGIMIESNRCLVNVYPDKPWATDCPDTIVPSPPTNLRIVGQSP